MAQIVIIKFSELNSCWSADQYTGNCDKCKNCLPKNRSFSKCKVKSEHHKQGVLKLTNKRIKQANRDARHVVYSAIRSKRKALKLFN